MRAGQHKGGVRVGLQLMLVIVLIEAQCAVALMCTTPHPAHTVRVMIARGDCRQGTGSTHSLLLQVRAECLALSLRHKRSINTKAVKEPPRSSDGITLEAVGRKEEEKTKSYKHRAEYHGKTTLSNRLDGHTKALLCST